jgi:hypothetical protein
MNVPAYHIFTKPGDARGEVDAILKALDARTPGQAGYRKSLYVTRADQTVVFTDDRASPIAQALRARAGWQEPEQ